MITSNAKETMPSQRDGRMSGQADVPDDWSEMERSEAGLY